MVKYQYEEKKYLSGRSHWAFLIFIYLLSFFFILSENTEASDQSLQNRDGIISRAWLENNHDYLTPDLVAQGPWTIFKGSLSLGYRDSTTWLRLKIDPQIIQKTSNINKEQLVLRILPNHLNEIAVFYSDQLSSPAYLLGDTTGPLLNNLHFISNAVVLSDIDTPYDIILRVKTNSNHTVDVTVLKWSDAVEENYQRLSFILAYIIFLSILTILAIMKYFIERDHIVLIFIIINLIAIVLGGVLLGLFRLQIFDIFKPIFYDRLTSYLVPLYFLWLLIFHAQILKYFGIPKNICKTLYVISIIPILTMVLVLLGFVREGLFITQAAIPICAIYVFLITFTIEKENEIKKVFYFAWDKAYLTFTYGVLAAVSIPQSLRILGIKKYGEPFFGGFAAYSILSTILLGFVLLYRSRQLEAKRAERDRALSLISHELEYLKNKAMEQSELITMLTHELKTPMSVITLALGPSGKNTEIQERAHRAVKNIKDIIQRCEHMARLEYPIDYSNEGIDCTHTNVLEILNEVIYLHEAIDSIQLIIKGNIPKIYTNQQLLFIIINNLIENGIKYGLPERKIDVSIEVYKNCEKNGIKIAVVNDIGKAGRPDRIKIFEKYYRSPHARYSSGSGLGLYLARRFAELLKGELKLVDSDKVRFELWLPI